MLDSGSQLTVTGHLLRHIRDAGVRRVFGVPGDFSLGVLEELTSTDLLEWIGCATEMGAAYCADGYARADGLGVVMTTFGVGELSAAVALAGSTAEGVGVLHVVLAPGIDALSAGAPLHHSFADGDLSRFERAAREWHAGVFRVGATDPLVAVEAAVHHWRSTRSTTYLLLPHDVARARPDADFSPAYPSPEVLTDEAGALIDEFVREHPTAVAVLGNAAQRHGLRTLVEALARKRIPMAVLPDAKGLVDESEPNYLGVYNGKLSGGDVAERVEAPTGRVLLGCTIADTTTGGLSHVFPPRSTLVVDPGSVSWGSRRAEAGIRPSAERWLLEVPEHDDGSGSTVTRATQNEIAQGSRLDQAAVWTLLSRHMPPGGRLFAETGSAHYGALDSTFPPDTVFEAAALWSAIGHALPAALGASLAESSRRVLAVIGDGAAQMTANELGLIDRFGANPILVLIENGGYTVERVIRDERASYHDIATWRWNDVPRALGASSAVTVRCDTTDAFAAALDAAFADHGNSHILVLHLDRYDASPSLLRMGALLRAKAGLPPLRGSATR